MDKTLILLLIIISSSIVYNYFNESNGERALRYCQENDYENVKKIPYWATDLRETLYTCYNVTNNDDLSQTVIPSGEFTIKYVKD